MTPKPKTKKWFDSYRSNDRNEDAEISSTVWRLDTEETDTHIRLIHEITVSYSVVSPQTTIIRITTGLD